MLDINDIKKKVKDCFVGNPRGTTPEEWIPVKEINDGIITLKTGSYVIIIEISPINFKLKSKIEKRSTILNFREFLKACNFPMQISVQCRVANTNEHIRIMQNFCEREENENARNMGKGYIKLVNSLGAKGAVTRRFFLIVPFVKKMGQKEVDFNDVKKQLFEKKALIKEYLKQCGNGIVEADEKQSDEVIIEILKTCINKI